MSIQDMFNRTGAELSADAQKVIDGTRAQAAAFNQAAETKVQRAMDNKQMSTRAQQAIAARTYRQTQAQTQTLLDQHITGVQQYKQKLVDRAFGARGGDAQTIANRRAAQQMVAGLDDGSIAMEMMRTAQQDGDTQLAQVIAGHAYSRGWNDVVDRWNHDGTNNTAMRNLVELQQLPDTNDIGWRMGVAAEFHVNPPAVLQGLRDTEIDALARDDLGGEAA
ncbi:hypothetical protein ACLQ2H_01270 [Streptomyces globisporus]|uniref:hypothetical protein n=1 Tax=Streptomyces globisporus TaxID=1908 RepID=UPI003CE8EA1B